MKRAIPFIALALLCGPAFAQPAPPPGPPPPPPGNQLNRLGLTPDQSKRIQDLRNDFGPKMRALERSLAEKRRSLEQMYREFRLDAGQARQMNAQINKIQQDILDAHLQLQVGLRQILTADQFSRLRAGMERGRFRRPDKDRQPGKDRQ